MKIVALLVAAVLLQSPGPLTTNGTVMTADQAPPVIYRDPLPGEEKPLVEIPVHCIKSREYIDKWAPLLKMQSWTFNLFCTERPPWEDGRPDLFLRGASVVFVQNQSIAIWISSREKDIELTVVHEMLHGVAQYMIEADSAVVQENAVRNLADLLVAYNDALMKHEKNEKRLGEAVENHRLE